MYYNFPHTVYPGETFHIAVVAVGQRNGAVPSTVRNIVEKDEGVGKLQDRQYLQHTNNTCTKLNYTVFSLSPRVGIELHVEGSPCPRQKGNEYKLFVLVHLTQSCPPGFHLSKSEKLCVCEPRLAQYIGVHQCNIINKWTKTNHTLSKPTCLGWI